MGTIECCFSRNPILSIWFKPIASFTEGQMFNIREEKDFDEVLLKPNAIAPRSKRQFKAYSVVVYFDRSFA